MFLIFEVNLSVFSHLTWCCSKYIINGFYHIDLYFCNYFLQGFFHEWVLNCTMGCFCVYGDVYVNFIVVSVYKIIKFIDLSILCHPSFSRMKPTWSWCMIFSPLSLCIHPWPSWSVTWSLCFLVPRGTVQQASSWWVVTGRTQNPQVLNEAWDYISASALGIPRVSVQSLIVNDCMKHSVKYCNMRLWK